MSDSNDSATGTDIDNDSLNNLLPNRSGSSNATMSERGAERSPYPSLQYVLVRADRDAVLGLATMNDKLCCGRGLARVMRSLHKAAPGFQQTPLQLSSDT